MPSRRNVPLTVAILLVVILGVIALTFWSQGRHAEQQAANDSPPNLSEYNTYLYEKPRGIRPFTLIDQQGELVTEDMFLGHWTIVFVGFTTCPDICPTTMATLSRAADKIPPEFPAPQFLMISADPERDTPEQLNRYVTFFGDDFLGVTGDYGTLESLARDLNAIIIHRENEHGEVNVDHSSHLALISPQGHFVGMIQTPHEAEQIAAVYRAVANWNPTGS